MHHQVAIGCHGLHKPSFLGGSQKSNGETCQLSSPGSRGSERVYTPAVEIDVVWWVHHDRLLLL